MAFETFFLFGSILLLAAVAWSMKKRDFERMGTTWPAAALTGVCGLLFAFHILRLFQNMETWQEGQLLMSAVTVGSLSAATVLMGLRTYQMWRRGQSSSLPS